MTQRDNPSEPTEPKQSQDESPTADTETLIDPVSPESARRNLEAERDLLLARQDALVRYLGRAEFLRAIGEADPCEVIAL